MKKIIVIVLLSAFAIPSFAQLKVFVKPAGIPGESADPTHPSWIDALASTGGECTVVNFTSGAGQPAVKDFAFTFYYDRSTNPLRSALFTGVPISTITVDYIEYPGALIKYKILMEDVYVTAIDNGWSSGDSRAIVNISFKPSRFRYTYYATAGNLGTGVVFGWNVVTGAPW